MKLEGGSRWREIENDLRSHVVEVCVFGLATSYWPSSIASRLTFVDVLLNPIWIDEHGAEHKGEPIISTDSARQLLELWDGMATCGPVNVDANGAPV